MAGRDRMGFRLWEGGVGGADVGLGDSRQSINQGLPAKAFG